MKTIKFVAFLFYRYYSTGPTKDIPYFSTLCALTMIAYLHLMQLLVVTHQVDIIIPIKSTDTKATKFLIMSLVFLVILFPLSMLIKKEELKSMSFPSDKIKRGNIFLIIYIILTMAVLIILAEIFK